jgi:hypothetical protein
MAVKHDECHALNASGPEGSPDMHYVYNQYPEIGRQFCKEALAEVF